MFGDLAAGTVLAGAVVQLATWPGTAFTTWLSVFTAVATMILSAMRTRRDSSHRGYVRFVAEKQQVACMQVQVHICK